LSYSSDDESRSSKHSVGRRNNLAATPPASKRDGQYAAVLQNGK